MKQLIDFGISKEAFLNGIADRKMHLVRGAFSADLVRWEHLDEAMRFVDPTAPSVRVHHGGLVPETDYVEDYAVAGVPGKRLRRSALQELLARGATVVLNRLDARFSLIRRLCEEVTAFSEAATLANGYLAFSGKGSFGNHWDTHDVMALQLIGRKRWRIFEPTFPAPLSGQTSRLHKDRCPSEPVFDGILEAGDLLYLPRGWWHDALPIGETFHVAVGMHTASVVHFVSWLCDNALRDHEALRRTVRPGADDAAAAVTDAAATVQRLMQDPAQLQAYLEAVMASNGTPASPFSLAELVPQPAVAHRAKTVEVI